MEQNLMNLSKETHLLSAIIHSRLYFWLLDASAMIDEESEFCLFIGIRIHL